MIVVSQVRIISILNTIKLTFTEYSIRLSYQKATNLLKSYQDTKDMVGDRFGTTENTKERADKLKKRANDLHKAVESKKRKLEGNAIFNCVQDLI